jgi:hypothetical protein
LSTKYFSSAALNVPVMRIRTDLLLAGEVCRASQPVEVGVIVPGTDATPSPLALSIP